MVIGVHGVRSLPARIGLFLGLILTLSVGCGGGGGGETTATPPATPAASTPAATGTGTTVGIGQAETLRDVPFSLNTDHPVPPDFREAYERRALISVQFYKLETDPLGYPEGLDVDQKVRTTMDRLRTRYPTIEFFGYDIDNPGRADKSEGLEPGQYGTLAAQLGVGFTPFVAMLAPSGDQYVITNLYQGYVSPPVLSQALYDLSSVQVEDNTSDIDVVLEQLELTESGGGLEYVKHPQPQHQTREPPGLLIEGPGPGDRAGESRRAGSDYHRSYRGPTRRERLRRPGPQRGRRGW